MTYDYNEHISRLSEQRDSVAREIAGMREDENYRFRELERRAYAEASERKHTDKPTYPTQQVLRAYERIGIESNQPRTKNEALSEFMGFMVLLFILIIALSAIL
jgi:hypothetical protein